MATLFAETSTPMWTGGMLKELPMASVGNVLRVSLIMGFGHYVNLVKLLSTGVFLSGQYYYGGVCELRNEECSVLPP